MGVRRRVSKLEGKTGAGKRRTTIFMVTDADRESLAAMQRGERAYVMAAPEDADLVEAARQRGVIVFVEYYSKDLLEAI